MTEKQRDMKYLHKYKTSSDFDNDYNGEYYHEPWVSTSPKQKNYYMVDIYEPGDDYLTFLFGYGDVYTYDGAYFRSGYLWYIDDSMLILTTGSTLSDGDTWYNVYNPDFDEKPEGPKYMCVDEPPYAHTLSNVRFDRTEDGDIQVNYNKRPEEQPDIEVFFDTSCGNSGSEGCRVDYEHANPNFGIYEEHFYSTSEGESEGECDGYYEYFASGTGINVDNLENFKMKFWIGDEPYEYEMVRSSDEAYVPGVEACYWPTNLPSDFNVYVYVWHYYDNIFCIKVYYYEAG